MAGEVPVEYSYLEKGVERESVMSEVAFRHKPRASDDNGRAKTWAFLL